MAWRTHKWQGVGKIDSSFEAERHLSEFAGPAATARLGGDCAARLDSADFAGPADFSGQVLLPVRSTPDDGELVPAEPDKPATSFEPATHQLTGYCDAVR
jgi:hypothetical protein